MSFITDEYPRIKKLEGIPVFKIHVLRASDIYKAQLPISKSFEGF